MDGVRRKCASETGYLNVIAENVENNRVDM